MTQIGPNERRCITCEDLGYYNSVVVGAVYDFASQDIDLRSPQFYLWPLKSCVEDHPFLNVIVGSQKTERPFYERVTSIHLLDHVVISDDLIAGDDTTLAETKCIETVLGPAADLSWLSSEGPPWRILVHPLVTSPGTKATKCFIALSFSHTLGDGLAGTAFHRTFLDALRRAQTNEGAPEMVTPCQTLPPAFDTPERLRISWGFLLAPLLAVFLPKFLVNFFGLRAAASTVDEGTWLGPPMFFRPEDFQTQVKLFEVDDSTLQNALRVCRRNGTKLTATLHQIVLRALSRAIPASQCTNFVSQTAVNMRSSIGAPDNEIGLYVTGYYEQYPRDDSSGPLSGRAWTAAGAMTKKLAETAIQLEDQPIGLLRYAPSIRGYYTGKLNQRRDCSYELSNLVAFSDAGGNANSKITKMVFGAPSGVVSSPLVFNVISVKGGSLMCAITWQPGALGVPQEDEGRFVQGICDSMTTDLNELE